MRGGNSATIKFGALFVMNAAIGAAVLFVFASIGSLVRHPRGR